MITLATPHRPLHLRLLIVGVVVSLLVVVATATTVHLLRANAAVVGWNAGNIIDDAVFTNKNSMSVADIQNFLNSKVPTCNNAGEQWGRDKYNQTSFTCLKDYIENGKSSAQIIYDAAQSYSINPQVILVLLQKEQALVTDDWPANVQYRSATGYGCPDTAACDSTYYGLTNQINWAAKMFRAIMNNSSTWYTPYNLGINYISYNPNAACGGSNVTIENRATQALYNYTPYQPNQAALDAGWGTASCGAYGNRNFYLYFTNWFGSTKGPDYAGTITSTTVYTDSAYTQTLQPVNGAYQATPGQTLYVKTVAQNNGRSTWDAGITKVGTTLPTDHASLFANSSWPGGSSGRAAIATGNTSTSPGQSATFTFPINTPSSAGRYGDTFAIVVEGKAWVANSTTSIDVIASKPLSSGGRTIAQTSLGPDSQLTPGQNIYSAEGHSVLHLAFDGNLELWTNYQKVWSTNTSGSHANRFVNQGDGNLVLYRDSTPVWSSNTRTGTNGTIALQADGNLVYYKSGSAVWASNTTISDQTNLANDSMLAPDQVIFPGQYLTTPNRYYRLEIQTDGNIVLYTPTRAIWSSNTYGHRFDRLVVQGDGNLVAYDGNNYPVWSSNTFMSGGNRLILQQDGNIVFYAPTRAVWSSNTFMVR